MSINSTMRSYNDGSKALDVWLKFDTEMAEANDLDDDMATHEANTYRNADGTYRIEWYLNSVGLVTTVHFDRLSDAHEWYDCEGFQDFTA